MMSHCLQNVLYTNISSDSVAQIWLRDQWPTVLTLEEYHHANSSEKEKV